MDYRIGPKNVLLLHYPRAGMAYRMQRLCIRLLALQKLYIRYCRCAQVQQYNEEPDQVESMYFQYRCRTMTTSLLLTFIGILHPCWYHCSGLLMAKTTTGAVFAICLHGLSFHLA